jgi:hypothetical protein
LRCRRPRGVSQQVFLGCERGCPAGRPRPHLSDVAGRVTRLAGQQMCIEGPRTKYGRPWSHRPAGQLPTSIVLVPRTISPGHKHRRSKHLDDTALVMVDRIPGRRDYPTVRDWDRRYLLLRAVLDHLATSTRNAMNDHGNHEQYVRVGRRLRATSRWALEPPGAMPLRFPQQGSEQNIVSLCWTKVQKAKSRYFGST